MKHKSILLGCISLFTVCGIQMQTANADGKHHGSDKKAKSAITCLPSTLKGNFTFSNQGIETSNGSNYYVAGIRSYEGNGTVTSTITKVIVNPPSATPHTESGSYTLNSDCTGTATFTTSGRTEDFFTTIQGNTVNFVRTDIGLNGGFDSGIALKK